MVEERRSCFEADLVVEGELRRRRRKNQIKAPIMEMPARAPITIPAMAPPEGEEFESLLLAWVVFESLFVVESEEDEDEPEDDDELELSALSVFSQVESHVAAVVAAPTVVSESWGIAWTLASW